MNCFVNHNDHNFGRIYVYDQTNKPKLNFWITIMLGIGGMKLRWKTVYDKWLWVHRSSLWSLQPRKMECKQISHLTDFHLQFCSLSKFSSILQTAWKYLTLTFSNPRLESLKISAPANATDEEGAGRHAFPLQYWSRPWLTPPPLPDIHPACPSRAAPLLLSLPVSLSITILGFQVPTFIRKVKYRKLNLCEGISLCS